MQKLLLHVGTGLLLGIDLIISFIAVVSREGRGNGEHGEHRVGRGIGDFHNDYV